MATLTLTVAASADDAKLDDLGYDDSATTINVGTPGSPTATNSGYGWRFTNVTIAPGSTITAVVLKLMKSGTAFAQQNNRWCFEAADDAATFSSGSPPGSRAITATVVGESNNVNETDGTIFDFPRAGGDQIALAAALQEVINRPGWASGNAVAILNQSKQDASQGAGFARKVWHSFDSTTPSSDPQLVITYTPYVPPTPWVDQRERQGLIARQQRYPRR